jgi:hypothetical protein
VTHRIVWSGWSSWLINQDDQPLRAGDTAGLTALITSAIAGLGLSPGTSGARPGDDVYALGAAAVDAARALPAVQSVDAHFVTAVDRWRARRLLEVVHQLQGGSLIRREPRYAGSQPSGRLRPVVRHCGQGLPRTGDTLISVSLNAKLRRVK